jgi:hypothetical protein
MPADDGDSFNNDRRAEKDPGNESKWDIAEVSPKKEEK